MNEELKSLNESVLFLKKYILKQASHRIHFICPSNWIGQQLKDSWKDFNLDVAVVPNCVAIGEARGNDLAVFEDNVVDARCKLLFIAANADAHHKGLDLLLEAMKRLTDSCMLFVVGNYCGSRDHQSVVFMGSSNNDSQLASWISKADAVVVPSREDNLPNVMLEAFVCGTPVIGTPVAGIADHIQNGYTGILASHISSEAIGEAITNFLSNKQKFNRESIRQYGIAKFSCDAQVKAMQETYRTLMKDHLVDRN
jgi:glycosyltransferase involved in cell wall biosynthesis